MTPLERSVAAKRAVKARWARTTVDERSAWARYMLAHQRRFWDGRTLPHKPIRARVPVPVGASVGATRVSASPIPKPPPPLIPVVAIPRRVREQPMLWPGVRYDV